jgi:hypothetical protein
MLLMSRHSPSILCGRRERRRDAERRWVCPDPLSSGDTPSTSAPDPVVHVGDAVLPLGDPGALQLDVLGREAVEQPASLAEDHRDDAELDLVQGVGRERDA